MSGVINAVSPRIVYIPHKGDLNRDHRLVFEAALVAMRPAEHRIERILSYETLSETEWGQPLQPFVPNVYVDVSRTFKIKLEAMQAYESELKRYPHPRSLEIVETLAKKRGSEVRLEFAEAFMLVREII